MSVELSHPESQVVVLTGNIGSGKTTVAGMFAELGASVIEADKLAREVVAPGSPALKNIVAEFGADFLLETGELNRKKLGVLVFGSSAALKTLESITHPEIRLLSKQRFSEAVAAKAKLIIYDCPLYFESGLDKLGFRASILVFASEATSISRVVKRDALVDTEVRARLRAQMPADEKRAKVDYLIDNNGTREQLRVQVKHLFSKLSSLA